MTVPAYSATRTERHYRRRGRLITTDRSTARDVLQKLIYGFADDRYLADAVDERQTGKKCGCS